MWILTPSITSAFAAATGASTSASSEQLASAFARSLLSRSKPSPQRTWLQRLKRDSWTTHLSGAISSDSLGESFTDWWTSSLAATRASHSAQPASVSAPKTPDTSGLTYQPELLSCDQQSAFSRMSKDTFLLGCATSSKTWADWVTEQRGAWRARVNAARLTRGKGSSSWPTIRASEYKDVGPVGSKSHDHMLGKHYLCAVVTQEERNGQAAPASSSTGGSRLVWSTPTPWQQEESMTSWVARKAKNLARRNNGNGMGTPLDMQVKQWATPRSGNPGSRKPGTDGKVLAEQANQWPTICAGDYRTPPTNSGIAGQTIMPSSEHALPKAAGGKLNPRWVETLMGLPIGWTMPSCSRPVTTAPTSCDSSATALCQPAQSERSDFLLAS